MRMSVLLVAIGIMCSANPLANSLGIESSCTAKKPWYQQWKAPDHPRYQEYLYFKKNSNRTRFDDAVPIGTCPFGKITDCPLIMICGTTPNNPTAKDHFAVALAGGVYVVIVLHAVWLTCFQVNTRGLHLIASFIFNNFVYTICLHPHIDDARPVESCMSGCGMPSGHVSNAYILLAWDIYWVFVLSGFGFVDPAKEGGILPGGVMWQRVFLFFVSSILLGPMAWARWQTRDHTTAQVFAGAFLGLLDFCIWQLLFWRQITRVTVRDWNLWEIIQIHLLCRKVHGKKIGGFWKEITGLSYDRDATMVTDERNHKLQELAFGSSLPVPASELALSAVDV